MENTKNDCTWSEKFPSWHVMYLANIKPVCLGLCCWNGDPGKGPYITLIALPPRLWASHCLCCCGAIDQRHVGLVARDKKVSQSSTPDPEGSLPRHPETEERGEKRMS